MAVRRRRLSVTVRRYLNIIAHFIKKMFFQFFKLSSCTDLTTRVNGSKCQLKILDYLSGCRYPSARPVAVRRQTMAVRRRQSMAVRRRALAVRQCLNVWYILISFPIY
jgi:hypothetical protein